MSHTKKTPLIAVFSCLIITGFFACSILESNDSDDHELSGIWYTIDTLEVAEMPDLRIRGWKIEINEQGESNFGTMHPIGIHGDTGELALRKDVEHISVIRELSDDEIAWDRLVHPGGLYVSSVPYSISLDELTFYYDREPVTYYRARLGDALVEGLSSYLGASINGEFTESATISQRPPSSYVSAALSPSGNRLILRLRSRMDNEQNASIHITIPYLYGSDTYILNDTDIARYGYLVGDLAFSYRTDADSSGYITIDELDMQNKRVTGSFAFTGSLGENVYEITDGTFDVPIFD